MVREEWGGPGIQEMRLKNYLVISLGWRVGQEWEGRSERAGVGGQEEASRG